MNLRHEFHEADGAIARAVKAKLESYQHDHDVNVVFLPAAMTTSGRISGEFFRLLYILSHRKADFFFLKAP